MISEVVILCGGQGTRLRSVVRDVPKPMAPVNGRPFLEILLSQLRAFGCKKAVLSIGYLASVITDHFGASHQGVELTYCVDPEPLGTGGAARLAAKLCIGDIILVCNGDTYLEFEFDEAFRLCEKTRSPVVVTLKVPDTERYGRINVQADLAANFAGRGIIGAGYISGGVYLVPRRLFIDDARPAPFSLEDFIFDPRRAGTVYAVEARGRFIDIGVPDDYALAQEMLKGK